MRQRRAFYLVEGGLLFWVLTRVREDEKRQFQDDVLYPNYCNVFAIDEETVALSAANAELMFRCGYLEPVKDGWTLKERWCERIVRFSELKFDPANQRVYYFDYDNARAEIEQVLRTIDGKCILDEFEALLQHRASHDGNMMEQMANTKALFARHVRVAP